METLVFPATVRQMADQLGVSISTVRNWIDEGHLKAEKPEAGPLVVVSGQRPISAAEWRKQIEACVAPHLRPGTWGFEPETNDFCLLRGDRVERVPFVRSRELATRAIAALAP